MDCYICGNEAEFLFEYKSSLSRTCREVRCGPCAIALRKSKQNILKDEYLGDGTRPLVHKVDRFVDGKDTFEEEDEDGVSTKQVLNAAADNQPHPWTPPDE